VSEGARNDRGLARGLVRCFRSERGLSTSPFACRMGKLITMKVLIVGMKGVGVETGAFQRVWSDGIRRK
jgi:hypothetical protein